MELTHVTGYSRHYHVSVCTARGINPVSDSNGWVLPVGPNPPPASWNAINPDDPNIIQIAPIPEDAPAEYVPSTVDPNDFVFNAVDGSEIEAVADSVDPATGGIGQSGGEALPTIVADGRQMVQDANILRISPFFGAASSVISGIPVALTANAAAEEMQALTGMADDVLRGTVSPATLASAIEDHTQLAYINQNQVQEGNGAIIAAPTPGDIPAGNLFEFGNVPASAADWSELLIAANEHPGLLAGAAPESMMQDFATLAAFVPQSLAVGVLTVAWNLQVARNFLGSSEPGTTLLVGHLGNLS